MRQHPGLTLLFLCVCILIFSCVASVWHLYVTKREALQAQNDFIKARDMIDQIVSHRDQPKLAEARDVAISDLRIRLEKAAQKASLSSLSSVWSENTRRLDQTPYLIQKTRVTIDHSTMRQMLEFLWFVEAENPSLNISNLRLSAENRNLGNTESWKGDLAVTNLIYSPKD
ncbi:hypothetical protein KS4_26400 [Poriferisphaera corsica]|uniref:Uncharacterized protein n=1 Tax=Poriferisphaera corsica TaxID=2528020 RepID=A0A517YWG7_9BACT|nr:hypothetical protein [Poriferisphaera corsica]QDU34570.1 hypothetical protein KS4_26400 [Poriferisphaera corsica]